MSEFISPSYRKMFFKIHRSSHQRYYIKQVSCSQKFHRETPVLESLFQHEGLFILKETPALLFSCETCQIFKNIDFEEHLRTTVSKYTIYNYNILLKNIFEIKLNHSLNKISQMAGKYKKAVELCFHCGCFGK